jgi:eukaryotic-like serine/threonine-protein kinase
MTQRQRDEDLFAAALLMPAMERGGFLARACAHDPPVLQRLLALLATFDDAADFVRTAALESQTAIEEIRSYRLLREIGEGGCGIAYLAEQLAPVRREVAIKVIKPGMDTKAVVARFEAERQLLALMDHPNVAKVFDAGSTAAGRPYFAMELVRGISITEYCDLMRLSNAGRLQLFVQVCQAIQHAHHKGVMHRDIKPSNVLVTMHDGLPLVKVIDFGIAKATQGPLSEHTFHTALEQFIGTPAYISPEQTELTQRNVDTRSDIYSLGVLLYELLTGSTPLDTEDLMGSSAEEMRRRVRDEEAPTPSARLKALQLPARDLQGDLDWIVMRCLEKEPARRYQNVGDVISDLRRYLSHEPVAARPPSVPYLLAKFARRNRATCAVLVGAALLVAAFVINMSVQSHRVAAERDRTALESRRTREVAEFMLDTLSRTEPFGYAETGEPETAQELLDRAARWLQQNRNQNPEVRARLLESVGRAYRRRQQDTAAIPFLEEALSVRQTLSRGADDAATVEVMEELATCMREVGNIAGSKRVLADATAMLKRLGEERTMLHARLLTNRGRTEMKLGRPSEAMPYIDAALALARELQGSRGEDVAALLGNKAAALYWQDELQEAETAARAATEICASYPKLYPDRASVLSTFGEILRVRRKFDEASAVLQEALSAHRKIYGEDNRRVADNLDTLAKLAQDQYRLAEAEALEQQALQTQIRAEGKNHVRTGFYHNSLAKIQLQRHRYADAEVHLQASLAVFADTLPPGHPYVGSSQHHLGEVMLATHRPAQAEALFRAAIDITQSANEPEWRTARSMNGLGEALYAQGRSGEARAYLVDSYRILAAEPKAEEISRIAARKRLMRFYAERGQPTRLVAEGHP